MLNAVILAERLLLIGPSVARSIQADPVWQKHNFARQARGLDNLLTNMLFIFMKG